MGVKGRRNSREGVTGDRHYEKENGKDEGPELGREGSKSSLGDIKSQRRYIDPEPPEIHIHYLNTSACVYPKAT